MSLMSVGFCALKIRCSVGILPHEREAPQEIIVDLKVRLPKVPSEAASSEEISSTIDYSELASICESVALRSHHGLLETLSIEMLDAVFKHFSCTKAWIRIEKPAALARASSAFVECEREI